jgi:hypothetical protein
MSKEEVIELLKPFKTQLRLYENSNIPTIVLKDIIDKIEIQYDIKPQYPTLREYLKKHSCGAYHTFIFEIDINFTPTKVSVIDDADFEHYYNPRFLGMYYVVNDEKKSNGGNCENYDCKHYLTLEAIK